MLLPVLLLLVEPRAARKRFTKLKAGANSLAMSHYVPQGIDWSGRWSHFSTTHAKVDGVAKHKVCYARRGVETCYQEMSRELWVDEPRKIRYDNSTFRVFKRSSAYIHPPYSQAVPLGKLATFSIYALVATPQLVVEECRNEPRVTFSATRVAQVPWYSHISLRLHYQVVARTLGGLPVARNRTGTFLIKLPEGQCDMVYGEFPSVLETQSQDAP